MENGFHQPVLAPQVVQYLITRRDGIYVDCTLGGGGHARYLLQALDSGGLLIGLDADAEALAYASQVLKPFPNKILRHAYFDDLEVVLYELEKLPVDGVFYDLGISSFQVDVERRGFSFQVDAPLDMRFNQQQRLTAADVLNTYPQEELERIIREYGEERHWRAIAREIVKKRLVMKLQSTRDLVEIVRSIVGEQFLIKSLARVFQAIRIEVNRELDRLKASLEQAFRVLRQGGRIVVLSYHSLEDRIVKEFFRYKASDCVCPPELPECVCSKQSEMKILTRHVVTPDAEEVRRNPRSRSARLRAAEKIVPYEEAAG
ncbi:MAG: 16S rRNA (cytosine(1402)-N(4))-methyltransferase RsmH [Calditrichaeota bacterium]|nr:16S rRNA (cytosine(1402)-N(4))-methyltransferase RsmH [Calditrichota bacterium]